jgi:hypothetical protein
MPTTWTTSGLQQRLAAVEGDDHRPQPGEVIEALAQEFVRNR